LTVLALGEAAIVKHAHDAYDGPRRRQPPVMEGRLANGTSARTRFGQRKALSSSSPNSTSSSNIGFGSMMFAAKCAFGVVVSMIVFAAAWFIVNTIRVS
jgi:hypothetical protein